jgi:hypothetical protein
MAFVVDASVVLKWFLADEDDRAGSLALLKSISDTNRPVVPGLWFYEIGNALAVAVIRQADRGRTVRRDLADVGTNAR